MTIEMVPKIGDLIGPAAGMRDVLLYVHGFNQTFETAALDAARLSNGIRFRGETMVFSWPSKAQLFDYGYDRESAMWSRDALEQVLSGLITSPAVGRVHIVAHSVGTMLTMEAIRQIYDRHGGMVAERIGTVVFASPDIDMDVFSSSVERIGPFASNITVITSTNDRALAVSRWIAGGITRVGAAEHAELKRLGLHVIDASKQGWGIINHDLFLSNAQIRQGHPPCHRWAADAGRRVIVSRLPVCALSAGATRLARPTYGGTRRYRKLSLRMLSCFARLRQ